MTDPTYEITLLGTARSPINSQWPAIGQVQLQFLITPNDPLQSGNSYVHGLSMMLNGQPLMTSSQAITAYTLSQDGSALVINTGDDQFYWSFGSGWLDIGDNSSAVLALPGQTMDISFYAANSILVPTAVSEPSTLALLLAAAAVGVLSYTFPNLLTKAWDWLRRRRGRD